VQILRKRTRKLGPLLEMQEIQTHMEETMQV